VPGKYWSFTKTYERNFKLWRKYRKQMIQDIFNIIHPLPSPLTHGKKESVIEERK